MYARGNYANNTSHILEVMVFKCSNMMININKVIGDRITILSIRLVKQDFRRSLRDLMNEFSQSVPVPICEKSIQRRLSNLWLSQENCC
jgi:hypothetical protein